jgi:hypothetical protein
VSTDLDVWWEHLRAAALVGTARREVPAWPDLGPSAREGASREEALLDAAALGDAVRRGGRLADRSPEADDPAPEETLPVAPSPAVQILDLLLHQGPVAQAARAALTVHWLRTATTAGRIVPPRLLPALLDACMTSGPARAAVRPVVGERGAWLAARNPAWDWLTRTKGPEPSAPASRAAAVAARAATLSLDDEPFLEECLDDRAKSVREEAQRLLDRLPGSARAARMADRLRPLLSVSGSVRKQLEVHLPDDPDPAAVRDGLTEPGAGSSRRMTWLQQIITGSPLSVWLEVGRSPEKVVGMLQDPRAVLPGLREAAAAQQDLDWARALLRVVWSMRLVALLPDEERDRLLAARIPTQKLSATSDVQLAPRPWGPRTSEAVLAAILRDDDRHGVRVLRDVLPEALHPSSLPAVERAMRSDGVDPSVRTALRDVLQYQSLHRSISEAFR